MAGFQKYQEHVQPYRIWDICWKFKKIGVKGINFKDVG